MLHYLARWVKRRKSYLTKNNAPILKKAGERDTVTHFGNAANLPYSKAKGALQKTLPES